MKFFKDEEFIRGNCPMTKEEVRILSTVKLELEKEHKALDIGAGTGSLSVQMSKFCSEVWAIERDDEALEVIYKNKEKFKCDNLKVIKGEALEFLNNTNEKFDRIFVGGSGGGIEEILRLCVSILKEEGIMVLNFITLDNLCKTLNILKELNLSTECIQVSISKAKGKSLMLMSNNPIFIVSVKK